MSSPNKVILIKEYQSIDHSYKPPKPTTSVTLFELCLFDRLRDTKFAQKELFLEFSQKPAQEALKVFSLIKDATGRKRISGHEALRTALAPEVLKDFGVISSNAFCIADSIRCKNSFVRWRVGELVLITFKGAPSSKSPKTIPEIAKRIRNGQDTALDLLKEKKPVTSMHIDLPQIGFHELLVLDTQISLINRKLPTEDQIEKRPISDQMRVAAYNSLKRNFTSEQIREIMPETYERVQAIRSAEILKKKPFLSNDITG